MTPPFLHRIRKSIIISVVSMAMMSLGAFAGSLTPSGAVGATMNTLAEIYASIAGSFNSSAIVSSQTGSLIQHLKYIESNLGFASGSNNIWNLNSGNVGIASSSPNFKLSVEGSFFSSSSFLPSTSGGILGDCDAVGDTLNWDTTTGRFTCGTDSSGGVSSNSLNFDEFQSALVVDTNTTITAGAFALTFDKASISSRFEVTGITGITASISNTLFTKFTAVGINTTNPGGGNSNFRGLHVLVAGSLTASDIGGSSGEVAAIFQNEASINTNASVYILGGRDAVHSLYFGSDAGGTQTNGIQSYNATSNQRLSFMAGQVGDRMVILANGNVGIGHDSPSTKFEVSGTASVSRFLITNALNAALGSAATVSYSRFGTATVSLPESNWITQASDLLISGDLYVVGSISANIASVSKLFVNLTGTQTTNAVCHPTNGQTTSQELVDCDPTAGDYMEMYPVASDVQEGDLVIPHPSISVTTKKGDTLSQVIKSSKPYDPNLMGIISVASESNDFNTVGRNLLPQDNAQPVALVGRVKVKVSLENGPIQVGDRLTSSTIPGVAMKATQPGMTVGMALEDLSVDSIASGSYARVMTFVKVGYWAPEIERVASDDSLENGGWLRLSFQGLLSAIAEGFKDLFGIVFEQGKIKADQLCAGEVCVNAQQLQELLNSVGSSVPAATSDTPTPSETPETTPEVSLEPTPEAIPESTPELIPEPTPQPLSTEIIPRP